MDFAYTDTRLRFRQQAPTLPDYCAHCKLVFDTLIEELELKNRTREGQQSRTFTIDYDALRNLLRIGKQRYYETLDWLDKHGFILWIQENQHADTIYILGLDEDNPDPAFLQLAITNRVLRAQQAADIRLTHRLDNIDPKLWENLRQQVFARDGHVCRYCGTVFGPMEIDHIKPLIKGGKNELDNLAVSCMPCNRAKGSKSVEDFLNHQQQ